MLDKSQEPVSLRWIQAIHCHTINVNPFFFFLREIIPYLVYMFFVKYLLEWGGLTKYNNQILKKKKWFIGFPLPFTVIYLFEGETQHQYSDMLWHP